MAPTLAQVNRRKWWVAITAIIENMMFSAVLLGWSSLLLMLKQEGFYSHLCVNETESLEVESQNFSQANNSEAGLDADWEPGMPPSCLEQDTLLNRYFTIGSSLLSAVTLILGVIMDKYGTRMIRMSGTVTFMVSCILFTIASYDTENLSVLMAPAVCLNGMGGVTYIFTSFPVPNFFADLQSTMISMMIGSYSASAVLYMLFKAAYDMGVSFQALMYFHASVGFLTFLNAFFNCPGEPIPGPNDVDYAIKLGIEDFKFGNKPNGEKLLAQSDSDGERISDGEKYDTSNGSSLTYVDKKANDEDTSNADQTYFQVLRTPGFILSLVMMCITQLRLIAYMGWLEMSFTSMGNSQDMDAEEIHDTVNTYTFIFGLMQVNCFLTAPVVGTIMDWKLKEKKTKKKKSKDQNGNGQIALNGRDDEIKQLTEINNNNKNKKSKKKKFNRKRQQLVNLFRSFLITNICQFFFGVILLVNSIPLQIIAFFLHTVIRTFLHSSTGALYASLYHFRHFGKLTGLMSFLSALFILFGNPLFVLVNTSLGGDPFWVNICLLAFSLLGFALPLYLYILQKRMGKTVAIIEEAAVQESLANGLSPDQNENSDDSDDEEGDVLVSRGALVF